MNRNKAKGLIKNMEKFETVLMAVFLHFNSGMVQLNYVIFQAVNINL